MKHSFTIRLGTLLAALVIMLGLAPASALAADAHSHAMSTDCSTTDGDQLTFIPLSFDEEKNKLIAGDKEIDGTWGFILDESANYYLAEDITLTNYIRSYEGKTINLCLNGHELKQSADGYCVIDVETDNTLNICDCQPNEGSYYVTCPGTANGETITGGVITGGSGDNAERTVNGGGLYVSGNCTLYGGTIAGNGRSNVTSFGGGGVYVNGGNFTMNGGRIAYNSGGPGGAISCYNDGTVNLNGGIIDENTIIQTGGAVNMSGSTLTITDCGIVRNHTAGGWAVGMNIQNNATVELSGRVIIKDGDTTSPYGCYQVNLSSGAFLTITGALAEDACIDLACFLYGGETTPKVVAKGTDSYAITEADMAKFRPQYSPNGAAVKLSLNQTDNQIELIDAGHTHDWQTAKYVYNDTHHWWECNAADCPITETSQKAGYAPHEFPANWTVSKQPTDTENGEQSRKCTSSRCAYTQTEVIPRLGTATGEVEEAAGLPPVALDAASQSILQEIAADGKINGTDVTVTLKVQAATNEADKTAIAELADGKTLEYLDFSLVKETTDSTGTTTTEDITDTGNKVLEIAVDFNFAQKTDVTVYRKHGEDAAAALNKIDAVPDPKADGTFRLDEANNKVYIYASKFSTYAIGYKTVSSGSSGGGGSRSSSYTITAKAGQGGTIDPKGSTTVRRGADKTFTITPDDGYKIADVLVDGKSVGAVKEYTFEAVAKAHTIQATFTEKAAAPGWNDCPKDDTCPISPYPDASPTAWYHDGVHYCIDAGLMQGNADGTFAPNANLTRAMLAQILYNREGRPAVSDGTSFADVAAGDWYAKAVIWAEAKGIVQGYGDNTFAPNQNISREELAAVLHRYAQAKAYDVSVGEDTNILCYQDAGQISEWSFPALQWAAGSGIMTGKENGALDPQGNATRAEAAATIQRLAGLAAK